MFTFLLSELLILREKKVRGFFFGPLKYQKNTNFQRILKKTPYRRVAQKKVQITLFLTHPVYNAVKQSQYRCRSYIYLRTLDELISIHDLHIYYWEHL